MPKLTIEHIREAIKEFEELTKQRRRLLLHACGIFPPAELANPDGLYKCLGCDKIWKPINDVWVETTLTIEEALETGDLMGPPEKYSNEGGN